MRAALEIPGWGMDRAMYDAVCRYLRLTPDPRLHDKVARYLLRTAAVRQSPEGFARWLSELRPGSIGLGFLDVWTRLLMPAHPWRFRLNGVVAVHECDPRGYREMMAGPASRPGAWLHLAGTCATYGLNLLLGALWLFGQAGAYAVAGRGLRRERRYFAGKAVLVTGAGRGLGSALSARLLSLGADVIALSRPGSALERLRHEAAEAGFTGRLRVVPADVAVPDAIGEALAAAGVAPDKIDVAIVNAGVKEELPVPYPEAALRRIFDVNVFGAMQSASAVLPHFVERGTGHLVFVSSQGRWHGMPRTGAYNASKAALSVLVESMAMDLGRMGRATIRITDVEPGLISTAMIGGGLLRRLLAVTADQAAARILRCAAAGRGCCRFPASFTMMTAVLVMLPRRIRAKVLGSLKE